MIIVRKITVFNNIAGKINEGKHQQLKHGDMSTAGQETRKIQLSRDKCQIVRESLNIASCYSRCFLSTAKLSQSRLKLASITE